MIPSPWVFALLALASWRTYTLIASDTILDPVRDRLLWTGRPRKPREKLITFLECPYCAGFWITFGWLLAYWLGPGWVMYGVVVMALAATVPLVEVVVDVLRGE